MTKWPLLRSLADEDRRRLLAMAHRRRFDRREVLFREGEVGDTLYLVDSGRVAVRVTTRRGDVATLAVLGPGDVVGELALLDEEFRRSATVVALEATTTFALYRREFLQLRTEHPEVDRFFVAALASVVQRLDAQVVEALYTPVDMRVLRRVLDLARLYGDGGHRTGIPLTQEDIASLAGTSRATVNRVLREAEEAGHVQLHRGRVVVLDATALARRAR